VIPRRIATECVAVEARLSEIIQTMEVLSCELIVSELVATDLVVSELTLDRVIDAALSVGSECVATGDSGVTRSSTVAS
jgi:hypothetical protein